MVEISLKKLFSLFWQKAIFERNLKKLEHEKVIIILIQIY